MNLTFYIDTNDWWIGYYRGDRHHYVCPNTNGRHPLEETRYMNEVERIVKICDELALPPDQWVLNGSAVLALRGIDRGRPMGDMDVFCSTEAWFDVYHSMIVGIAMSAARGSGTLGNWELILPDGDNHVERCDPPFLRRSMYGLEVDLYFQWRRREAGPDDYDPRRYIESAEYIYPSGDIDGEDFNSIPCVPLGFIIGWKMGMGRVKDLRDVAVIKEYLGQGD